MADWWGRGIAMGAAVAATLNMLILYRTYRVGRTRSAPPAALTSRCMACPFDLRCHELHPSKFGDARSLAL